MFNGKKVLAFIPARGGSKGIPGKNIVNLGGKPLIAYTIEAAIQSKLFDKIVVSTNDKKIAAISEQFGADVPFFRPDSLSTDTANVMDAIIYVMDIFDKEHCEFDIIVYMQPTSPFRTARHIQDAFTVFKEKNADVVASVNLARSTYQRMNVLPDNGCMHEFIPSKKRVVNRQELRPYYELNGALHIAKWGVLKKERYWYVKKSFAYVMPFPAYLDIDEPRDLLYAEYLLKEGAVPSHV